MMVCCTPAASHVALQEAVLVRVVLLVVRPPGGTQCRGRNWTLISRVVLALITRELGEEFCGFTRLHPVCLVVIPASPATPARGGRRRGWVWAGRNGDIARGSAGIIVTNTLVMVCLTAPLFRLILSALTSNWRRDSPLNEIPRQQH
ncbi:hypothetical protein E2C01_033289 [Portunus trituberculatus]|uniref:Uncharacterized protein n=1 Tax=Portunus trituberculatus TaxID=210409 RepID=A0A5B7EYB4_PORTR|nr:hypothetical protein [Portunus trituberculatus]